MLKLKLAPPLLQLAFYATLAISACNGEAMAQTAAPAAEPGPATALAAPVFLQTIASMDAFEQRAGKVATVMGSSLDVRKYSHTISDDHAKSAVALSQAVSQAQLPAPTAALTPEEDATVKALYTVPSKDFDRAYMTGEVASHQQALALAQAYAAGGDNTAVKAIASGLVPTIQRRLDAAKAVLARIR